MKKHRTDHLLECFKSGLYYVDGEDIWSAPRMRGFYMGPAKKLRPNVNHKGYPMVAICLRKRVLHYPLHQLIWVFHNGEIPDNLEINHKDGNKLNNSIGNLELMTRQQNAQHAQENNLFSNKRDLLGRYKS